MLYVYFLQNVEPTPRTHRITADYHQEFPSVEVQSRKLKKAADKSNMENVKLEGEVIGGLHQIWFGFVCFGLNIIRITDLDPIQLKKHKTI